VTPIDRHLERLIMQASKESANRQDYFMHLQIPLPVLIALVGFLQHSLRSPDVARGRLRQTRGVVERTVEQIIQRLRDDGLPFNAQFLEDTQPPARHTEAT